MNRFTPIAPPFLAPRCKSSSLYAAPQACSFFAKMCRNRDLCSGLVGLFAIYVETES